MAAASPAYMSWCHQNQDESLCRGSHKVSHITWDVSHAEIWILNLLIWNPFHFNNFESENVYVGLCLSGKRKLEEAKSNISPQTTLMSNVPSLQYHYGVSSLFTKLFEQHNNLSYSDYPFWSMQGDKKRVIYWGLLFLTMIGLKKCNWWTSLRAIGDCAVRFQMDLQPFADLNVYFLVFFLLF